MILDGSHSQDELRLAAVLQTSAIVVFAEASSRKKAFRTAQSAKLVQLILAEPEEHYGLKGKLCCSFYHLSTEWDGVPHFVSISTHLLTGRVLCRPCGGSQGALSRE